MNLLDISLQFQDPKRKIHKPVKGVLRLEIEKLQAGPVDFENASEGGSVTNETGDHDDQFTDSRFAKSSSNGSDGPQNGHSKLNFFEGKEMPRSGSIAPGNPDVNTDDVSATYINILLMYLLLSLILRFYTSPSSRACYLLLLL